MTLSIPELLPQNLQNESPDRLALGPNTRLGCEDIERFALSGRMQACFMADALECMARSRQVLAAAHARGEPIYGLTTGFGPHVRYAASACVDEQGAGLIAHLGAGWGPHASEEVTRATMLVRARTLASGMSGIAQNAAEALVALLNSRVCPLIPEIGSVGASGDLIPLSFIARVLMGEGQAICGRRVMEAQEALDLVGLRPITLSGRDALALVNGTAFMTAYAALALSRAQRLIERAERLTGWIYRVLGARLQALDPRLHVARGHPGQIDSASMIYVEALSGGACEDVSRPLQEVYSIRCAPQLLGACRDQITHARVLIEREINGVNDNPLIQGDLSDGAVLHGGNFQGQQIAFAGDTMNTALVQAAVLAERQLDVLVNPDLNGGGPLLLAWQPGATSGLAGAQLTATALVAEMRHHSTPVAISSIPTNGRNQDVVSMGTLAARAALAQTERLAGVLAILAIAVEQLTHLRTHGRAPGHIVARPTWMPAVTGFDRDRPLYADIQRLTQWMLAAA